MADLVLTIPNNQITRLTDALCSVGGYTGDPTNQPARREFARTVVRDMVRRAVLQEERERAVETALTDVVVPPISID